MRTPEEIAEKACSIQGSMRGYATSIVAVRIAQAELAKSIQQPLQDIADLASQMWATLGKDRDAVFLAADALAAIKAAKEVQAVLEAILKEDRK